ncbi:MAG: PCRF domain-containing protein [Phycisphaerae bacterium]
MAQSVDDKLLAKLDELSKRKEHLDAQMADPDIAIDHARVTELAKESGKLRYLIDPYRALRSTLNSLEEARSLAHDSTADADLRELAQEELPDLEEKYNEQMEMLKDRVVSADDAAISSLILEVRAGTGGDEAALFARDLYEMYLRFAQLRKFKVEVLDQSMGEMGGLKEIVLNIRGDGAWQALGYEGGGHRVQRVPETEAQGRIHTSAATVAVFPEPEEVNIDINWDTRCRRTRVTIRGPAGSVNKTSSAILLVHTETEITVSMQDEKSQHKNRAKARRIMTNLSAITSRSRSFHDLLPARR